jgi:hypothetical protein
MFSVVILLIWLILLIKSSNALTNHRVISEAIYAYRRHVISEHDYKSSLTIYFDVEYKDAEDIIKTLFRLWDWSYKRILPADKFAIIEPYIKY